jgi:hypothetical protein
MKENSNWTRQGKSKVTRAKEKLESNPEQKGVSEESEVEKGIEMEPETINGIKRELFNEVAQLVIKGDESIGNQKQIKEEIILLIEFKYQQIYTNPEENKAIVMIMSKISPFVKSLRNNLKFTTLKFKFWSENEAMVNVKKNKVEEESGCIQVEPRSSVPEVIEEEKMQHKPNSSRRYWKSHKGKKIKRRNDTVNYK